MVRCGACIWFLTSCYTFCGIRIRLIYHSLGIVFFHQRTFDTFSLRKSESWNDYPAIYVLTHALSQSWLFKKSSRNVEAYLSKDFFESSLFGIQARWRVSPRSA